MRRILPHRISVAPMKQIQRTVKILGGAAKWKLDPALFMGAAEHLPFRDEAFEVVFHFGGINFFSDKAAAIREMLRVAKPGCKFVS